MGYLDFVDLLLEDELGLREGRRFRNASRLSGLPHHKTFDEFDFAFQTDLDARKVRDLATPEFVRPSPTSLCSAARRGEDHDRDRPRRRSLPSRVLRLLHHPGRPGAPLRTAEATGRFARQLAPTSGPPPPSSSTRSATYPWTGPRPTWCSNSSPAATNAAP